MRTFAFVAFIAAISAPTTLAVNLNTQQVDKSHINFDSAKASVEEGGTQYMSDPEPAAPKKKATPTPVVKKGPVKAAKNSVDTSPVNK